MKLAERLYIFWFLHQTTTCNRDTAGCSSCISFDSYIKPQHDIFHLMQGKVVYLLIPTSNHNLQYHIHQLVDVVYLLIPTSNHNEQLEALYTWELYIFWFLHQTTTEHLRWLEISRCISFDSYIKPQPIFVSYLLKVGCISFDSYIKPQQVIIFVILNTVVYLLIPTSNHNRLDSWCVDLELYIFWFLHQTTTLPSPSNLNVMLYIFWFLHQTTTSLAPVPCKHRLYIFWFLHQTTTEENSDLEKESCISFDSYIKPQLSPNNAFYKSVVYLLIPTSNHNISGDADPAPALYIFWFLHQTTTFCS